MNRIAINRRQRQSHLARDLGAATSLPITHLDNQSYDRHRQPLPADRFAQLQLDLVARARWIIDGSYATALPSRNASETDGGDTDA
jgi:hypothetical protein